MRKLTYALLGAAALSLASCSQEDLTSGVSTGEEVTVNFNLTLPQEFSSRSYGDGTTAINIYYTIFDNDNSNAYVTGGYSGFNGDGVATISLNLVSGKSYIATFFGLNNENTAGVFSYNNGVVTFDYSKMTAEGLTSDYYDCFSGQKTISNISGTTNVDVTLTRAVSQINYGTSDLADTQANVAVRDYYGTDGENASSVLTATRVPNTLNILTGATSVVKGDNNYTGEVTLPALTATQAASFGTFHVTSTSTSTSYTYLYSAYLLTSASPAVYDLTLTVSNTNATSADPVKIPVSSAPVQANFRTNIYGALLSASTTFTVDKNANWGTPSNDVQFTWDGVTVTYPEVDESTGNVPINRASDLAGLAAMVNGSGDYEDNPQTFEGKTIVLAADFDMANYEFPGIGSATQSGNGITSTTTSFKGTFDGQNNTISNVVINNPTASGNDAVGMFASVDGSSAEIKNLTINGITLTAPGAKSAGLIGILSGGAKVTNVKVTSGTVTGKQGVGAVVGRVLVSGTVSGCSNAATVTSTSTNTAGVVGAAYYTSSTEVNITINDCHNTGNVTGNGQAVAGVVGLSSANITGCTNSGVVTNNGTTATGGVVGQQNNAGTISGCSNTGLVNGGTGYGSGGIVGWVRYGGNTDDYPYQEVITVKNCNNSGNVIANSGSATGTGGIVGVWYMAGVCTENQSTAQQLVSKGFVGGIIGTSQWNENGPNTDTAYTDKLILTNNVCTTSLDNMTGSMKGQFIYINTPGVVEESGNTTTLPEN